MGFGKPSCSVRNALRMFGGMDGAYDALEGDIKACGEGGEAESRKPWSSSSSSAA